MYVAVVDVVLVWLHQLPSLLRTPGGVIVPSVDLCDTGGLRCCGLHLGTAVLCLLFLAECQSESLSFLVHG